MASQNAPATLPFVAGSLGVWTGFDYAGESEWPAVSSSFGAFDLVGNPKPTAYWYRANWQASPAPALLYRSPPALLSLRF